MDLLRVISSLNPRGGGPIEAARQFDEVLARRGVHVEVVCLDAPDAGDFRCAYPARVHALGPSWSRYGYNRRLVPWLRANRSRFNAVIVNGLWQYHGFAVWHALAGTDTPYLVYAHGMLDPWFKHTYPLKHLKKWLYWPWAEYRVLRDASTVLFTSEEERQLASKSFWLYRCNEVVTPYGTASPPANGNQFAASFLERYPELRNKRIFLFLSRIHEKKGCDLLIEAFARVAGGDASLHLVMAGPDQTGWQAALQRQADALGIAERITWLGMLQGADKWGAFYSADAFCLPSHQENFGVAVAEALACGKPVLISNKVNIWREIEADGAGVVGEDTVEGTTEVLNTWLAMTDEARGAARGAAKRCFDARFRIERAVENLIDIISSGSRPVGKDIVQSTT